MSMLSVIGAKSRLRFRDSISQYIFFLNTKTMPASLSALSPTLTTAAGTYLMDETGSFRDIGLNNYASEYDHIRGLWGWRGVRSQTNLCLYSSDFSNAAWTYNNLSRNDAVSCITGQTASRLTSSGSDARASQTRGVFSGTASCVYAIFEEGDSGSSDLRIYDATAAATVAYCRITYATGLVSTIAGTVSSSGAKYLNSVGKNGGKLYLVWFTYAGTAGNTRQLDILPTGGGSIGTESYCHHVQLVAEAAWSPPIVTAGSSVARGACMMTISPAPGWMNLSGPITTFTRHIQLSPEIGTNTTRIQIDNGTSNERVLMYVSSNSARTIVIEAGISRATLISGITFETEKEYVSISRIKADDFAAVINSRAPVKDLAGAFPVGMTRVSIGGGTSVSPASALITEFAVIPFDIPDTDLQRML